MNNPDLVFMCRKCGHNLYFDKEKFVKDCDVPDCPECGEEGNENWIFLGEGNYDKEFGKMNLSEELIKVLEKAKESNEIL